MEQKRRRINIKLVTDKQSFNRYVSKPTFVASKIFDENLVAVHNMQNKITLDKPIYVGFSIFDISKTLMYDFHYKYIKEQYPGKKSQLHYMDTDSLLYTVKTASVYEDMHNNKERFNLSEITDERFLRFKDNTNKKVVGKIKMEKDHLKSVLYRKNTLFKNDMPAEIKISDYNFYFRPGSRKNYASSYYN